VGGAAAVAFWASRQPKLALGDDGLGDHGALRLLGDDRVEVGSQVVHIAD
jgi:hypothetical protein